MIKSVHMILRIVFYIISAYGPVETEHSVLLHKWISTPLRESEPRDGYRIKHFM